MDDLFSVVFIGFLLLYSLALLRVVAIRQESKKDIEEVAKRTSATLRKSG